MPQNNRPVIPTFPRGEDGLFVEPGRLTPDVQRIIDENRECFAEHLNYADPWCGDPESCDPHGDYNCGRCNMAQGNGCLLLDIPEIDPAAGSCEDWEKIDSGDAEPRLKRKPPAVANYGVAKNGQGFGCKRCPYASPAKNPDGKGRTLWCGEGGFHVTPTACCTANGAPTVGTHADDAAKYETMMRERPGEYWRDGQAGYRMALVRRGK